MDIRLAQKIASENELAKGLNLADAPLEFDLLSKEVAATLDAWHKGCGEVSERLANITIFVMALAETVGTDLQEVIVAKLNASDAVGRGQFPHGATARNAAACDIPAVRRGKLVRDKIPQIIRSKGQEPLIYTASPDEYSVRLRDKLREEVEEFLASDNDPEELADILEVLHALAGQAGADRQQLEKLRAAKAAERGGFTARIVWSGNQTDASINGA
jgi:predicted house-cleaning noncanonical NTP pyrophosphatase (MazG superfamily)